MDENFQEELKSEAEKLTKILDDLLLPCMYKHNAIDFNFKNACNLLSLDELNESETCFGDSYLDEMTKDLYNSVKNFNLEAVRLYCVSNMVTALNLSDRLTKVHNAVMFLPHSEHTDKEKIKMLKVIFEKYCHYKKLNYVLNHSFSLCRDIIKEYAETGECSNVCLRERVKEEAWKLKNQFALTLEKQEINENKNEV